MAKREGSRDFNIPRNNGSQVVHPQGVDISSGASENWRKKRKRRKSIKQKKLHDLITKID